MLNNAQIKARYEEMGLPIDRNGAYVRVGDGRESSIDDFSLLLHYHIIQGLDPQDAKAQLMANHSMSDFEASFLVKKTLAFIHDVLEIDLEEVRKGRASTAALCGQLIVDVIAQLNAAYDKLRYLPITVNGHSFEADVKAREAMLGYLMTDRVVEYWVTETNEQIELTLDELKIVYSAITERDADLHKQITDLKTEARIHAEQRTYAKLVELSDRVKAM